MPEERCVNCHFFDAGWIPSICRRYPPTFHDWAVVRPNDWCGEYQPNEQERQRRYAESMKGDF